MKYTFKKSEESSHIQIATLIKKFDCKEVLDLGCAGGFLFKALGARWKGNLTGIEYDKSWGKSPSLKRYKKIIWADLNKIDISHILESNQFDAIIAADVLEHLNKPELTIAQGIKLLTPKGYIISSLPNCNFFPVLIIRRLLSNFRMSNGPLDFTHKHFYNLDTAKKIFKKPNLLLVETKTTPAPLDKINSIFLSNHLLRFFYRITITLARILPNYLSYQFIFVYKRFTQNSL